MNIEEFTAFAAEKIRDYLPEEEQEKVRIETAEVMKNNDRKLHGISFMREDDPSPTFYLEDLYQLYTEGADVEQLLAHLAVSYLDTRLGPMPSEVLNLEFSNVKERLGLRLLGMEYNSEFLSEVMYREVGCGMALVCDVRMRASDGGLFSTVVTKDLAESHHYDEDEAFKAAFENSWRTSAPVLESVGDILSNSHSPLADEVAGAGGRRLSKMDQDETAFVLTLENPRYGAAALFYPGMQEMIAESLEESYYAIPSSIHEFIIVRDSVVDDPIGLVRDLHEANKTLLAPQEVLSNNLLRYDKDTGALTPIIAEKVRA